MAAFQVSPEVKDFIEQIPVLLNPQNRFIRVPAVAFVWTAPHGYSRGCYRKIKLRFCSQAALSASVQVRVCFPQVRCRAVRL